MSQLHRTWKDRNISINTYNIFTYAAKTWAIKAADRQLIDAFEMWCWRRMLRIPWTAHRTNASILKQLKITRRLSTTCLKRILDYFGHIARRDGDNLENILVTGKRPGGRSPIRWSDQIRTALDTKVHTALNVAQMSCPAPLKNRDFVLQRSWLDTGEEKMILNHSVFHKDYPPRKGYVRALSLLTGFVVRRRDGPGSWLGYVSRSDPRGALPAWLVNRVTAQLAPRLVQQLHAAARRYPGWKALTDTPYFKPWKHPEQVPPYRIKLEDCVDPDAPPPPPEPKPNTSKSKLEVRPKETESHSVEDLGDISSEFSVEVEELADLTLDPAKKKGKFYKLVKSMKNRRKSVQVAKSADNLTDGKTTEEKHEKRKSSFKFHRRFSLSRGKED
ncbi:jg5302 [Pararge aegeria aegeria]|uniref:Jg5302 protein n=1 Tax=Pararge aegeria aegeria TaxID=348720 RepID=A0A8S4RB02_9NEOP|nr:jg5302 [Pararge aegeria aegeria]